MKFFAAVALFAVFAVAFAAEKPAEPKASEPLSSAPAPAEDAPRDKRGLLLSYSAPIAPIAAPLAYSSYPAAPIYSSSYSLPYAYRAYPYSSYYSSYYL